MSVLLEPDDNTAYDLFHNKLEKNMYIWGVISNEGKDLNSFLN